MDKTKEYYDKNANSFFYDTYQVDMGELYSVFLNHVKNRGKVLDLGCGSGRDLLHFKSCGYNVVGIDFSEELVKLAREYTGEKIIQVDIREIDLEYEFDGVWACASLLHLNKEDLHITLNKLFKSLKKNGVLYISFKYGTFEGFRNSRYFNDFNEEKLISLFNYFPGFEIIKLWKTTDKRNKKSNNYWLNCLVRKILHNSSFFEAI